MLGSKLILVSKGAPGDTYKRQWTGPSLSQVMAWRLFGAKSLFEPTLIYCHLLDFGNKIKWNSNWN